LGVGLLLAAQLIVLGLRVYPHRLPTSRGNAGAPLARSPVDINAIIHAPLFGNPEAAPVDGANAPLTRVPLVLVGTLANTDPTTGLAILGETAPTSRVYAVGATLPGGVRLHEVYPDRVVLDRAGVLETLPMPRQWAGGPAPVSGSVPTAPSLAANVQHIIAQGPEVMGEILRPMPTYANGQLKGFRVYAGRDRTRFTKLGLQAGDLVTQINGVPLTDPQHGMEILRGLANGTTATVSVERAGANQTITIDASQLNAVSAQPTEAPAQPGDAPAAPPESN
jgi:general secretion pathway protein C